MLFVGMYPDKVSPYRNVFFQNLIYAMADSGVECTVISPIPITRYRTKTRYVSKKRKDITPRGNTVTVYHPRYISLSSKRIASLNTGIWSEKLFEEAAISLANKLKGKFSAVYGHFFLSGGLAAIRIGRQKNISSFVAYGECNYESEIVHLYRELSKDDVLGLSGIVVVSTHNANVLKSKGIFSGIPMIIAPNSVDMTLFYKRNKNECREKLGLPLDKFIVGFVGGFIERKGDKRLLAAINQIDGLFGAFAGKGENPPEGKKVLLCKALNHNQIPILLNAIDVFCLPTQNEGSCNALVEAAACGVPIISSDLPFNDDLLNSENSMRINPNSIDEIRNALDLLFAKKDLRITLGEKIFNASRQFDIKVREKKIELFIRENLGRNND